MWRTLYRVVIIIIAMCQLTTIEVQATTAESFEQMVTELEQMIDNMPQYRVTYKLTNIRSVHTTAVATIINNQQLGNSKIRLDYYYRGDSPRHIRVEFLAYNHFERVYVKQSEWLHGANFSSDVNDERYIQLAPDQLRHVLGSESWHNVLFLRPNWTRFRTPHYKAMYQLADWHGLTLRLANIPEGVFNRHPLLSWHYTVTTDNAQQFIPSLDIRTQHRNMQWNIIASDNFSVPKMTFDTSTLMEKLTKLSMTYQPNERIYRLQLEGIVENIHLNLFQLNTAHFKTYDYRLDYEWRPSNEALPDESTLLVE